MSVLFDGFFQRWWEKRRERHDHTLHRQLKSGPYCLCFTELLSAKLDIICHLRYIINILLFDKKHSSLNVSFKVSLDGAKYTHTACSSYKSVNSRHRKMVQTDTRRHETLDIHLSPTFDTRFQTPNHPAGKKKHTPGYGCSSSWADMSSVWFGLSITVHNSGMKLQWRVKIRHWALIETKLSAYTGWMERTASRIAEKVQRSMRRACFIGIKFQNTSTQVEKNLKHHIAEDCISTNQWMRISLYIHEPVE